jgi:hypothetical protein
MLFMKLTKARLQKIINNKENKQTRKKVNNHIKVLNHTNTARNKKQFNLLNRTIKHWS